MACGGEVHHSLSLLLLLLTAATAAMGMARPESMYPKAAQVRTELETLVTAEMAARGPRAAALLTSPPWRDDGSGLPHPASVYGVRLSSDDSGNSNNNNSCPLRVALLCGMHAREAVTTALCLRVLRSQTLRDAVARGSLDLTVLPQLNPGGMDVALTLNSCLRSSLRGVDLNRNWPRVAPRKPLPAMRPEEAPGPWPLSEPETAFAAAVLAGNASETGGASAPPDFLLAIHSGGTAVLMPYDEVYTAPWNRRDLVTLARRLRDAARCPECTVASGIVGLYPAAGTMTDWAYRHAEVPLVLTLEVFEGTGAQDEADAGECTPLFNPVTTAALEDTLTRWTAGIEAAIESAAILAHSYTRRCPRV